MLPRKRFWFVTLSVLSLLALLACLGYWWDRWPAQTKERLANLLERRDVVALNQLFSDSGTWKVTEKGEVELRVGEHSYAQPAQAWESQLRETTASLRGLADRLYGRGVFSFKAGSKTDWSGPMSTVQVIQVLITIERGNALAEVQSTPEVILYSDNFDDSWLYRD